MPQGKRTCKKLIDGKECGHLNGLKADECEKCGNRFPKKKKTKSHKMPTAEQWQNIRCANHALTTAVTSGAVSLDGAHLNEDTKHLADNPEKVHLSQYLTSIKGTAEAMQNLDPQDENLAEKFEKLKSALAIEKWANEVGNVLATKYMYGLLGLPLPNPKAFKSHKNKN